MIASGPNQSIEIKSFPSGEAIPVWLLFPYEEATLHTPKGQENMNSESINKVTDQAVEQLVQAPNAGQNEALTRYLGTMAKFRTYSFLNVLLILKARPNASRVAGYKTWYSFGRQVKQGEKGILILAPMFRKTPETPEETDAAATLCRISGFRPAYVWDEQETTGKDLPQIGTVTGDPSTCNDWSNSYAPVEFVWSTHPTSRRPEEWQQKGHMTLLPDLTPAETFATLVHELAHSDMHFGERRSDRISV